MILGLWAFLQRTWAGDTGDDTQTEAVPALTVRVYDADVPEGKPYREVTLTQPVNWIGRGEGNDVALNASHASRRHCVLRLLKSGEVDIEDVGSKGKGSQHGTYLFGVRQMPGLSKRLSRHYDEKVLLGPQQYEGDYSQTALIVIPALVPKGMDANKTPILSHTLMAHVVLQQGQVSTPLYLDNLPYILGKSNKDADIRVPGETYTAIPDKHLKIFKITHEGVEVRVLDTRVSVHKQGQAICDKWLQSKQFVWQWGETLELGKNRRSQCQYTPVFVLKQAEV